MTKNNILSLINTEEFKLILAKAYNAIPYWSNITVQKKHYPELLNSFNDHYPKHPDEHWMSWFREIDKLVTL